MMEFMKIKHTIRNIIDFVADAANFIIYIAQIAIFDSFRISVKNENQQRGILVLANGPSLKKSLEEIIEKSLHIVNDTITVNFMANEDSFYVVKPKYHVISDYNLFHNSVDYENKVSAFYDNINKRVTWQLTILVTYSLWKDKDWCKNINNQNVKMVPFHSVETPMSLRVSCWLDRLGILGANYGSVLHHAIYLPMLLGYKKIDLYGADHTFFDGLCVDSENRVCRKVTHFYDNTAVITPVYHSYTGQKVPYKMSYFVYEYYRVFLGHDILRHIADCHMVEIYNRTPISLIDSYKRN